MVHCGSLQCSLVFKVQYRFNKHLYSEDVEQSLCRVKDLSVQQGMNGQLACVETFLLSIKPRR